MSALEESCREVVIAWHRASCSSLLCCCAIGSIGAARDRRLTTEGRPMEAAREAARRGSSAAPIPQPRKRRACPPGTVRTANAKTSVLSQKLAIIDSP